MGKTTEKKKYFVVRERAVPEVLLKVVQAKKLLDSETVSYTHLTLPTKA